MWVLPDANFTMSSRYITIAAWWYLLSSILTGRACAGVTIEFSDTAETYTNTYPTKKVFV